MPPSDAAPTPAQADFLSLGYGMFIHFGPWTFTGTGDGKFPAERVDAPALDMRAVGAARGRIGHALRRPHRQARRRLLPVAERAHALLRRIDAGAA